ncbi:CLUMA_CG020698, isoform A [Clunio marinus]|uniref:CLUMA_CG020698, isoform A n=1 Tax=Clunio marinus TaxID=568069 RepID=A0A1J1J5R9_9DIPT|nr:CLUMA_CG020698, isoform A [Clunio marinus]
MSYSNSPMSFLDEDKYNSERILAMKYIKDRIERASTVQNILAPITSQDEYIFEKVNDNASDVSELSDPFAEIGTNIIYNAEHKQKRRLSKVEADVLIMNSFPPTHMEVQNELVGEMKLKPPNLDVEKIMENLINKTEAIDDDSEGFKELTEKLKNAGLEGHKERKKKLLEKEKLKQKPKIKKTKEEQDLEASSMLSGVWRMLDAASMEEDGFPITQAGYNFYEDKKTRVLPSDLTWNQKEEIRRKCENWLKEVK